MGWEAPSNYHPFGFVKNQKRGQHYETNKALQTAVHHCLQAAGTKFYCKGILRAAGTKFYRKGIFKLPERWKKFVKRNGDYVQK